MTTCFCDLKCLSYLSVTLKFQVIFCIKTTSWQSKLPLTKALVHPHDAPLVKEAFIIVKKDILFQAWNNFAWVPLKKNSKIHSFWPESVLKHVQNRKKHASLFKIDFNAAGTVPFPQVFIIINLDAIRQRWFRLSSLTLTFSHFPKWELRLHSRGYSGWKSRRESVAF